MIRRETDLSEGKLGFTLRRRRGTTVSLCSSQGSSSEPKSCVNFQLIWTSHKSPVRCSLQAHSKPSLQQGQSRGICFEPCLNLSGRMILRLESLYGARSRNCRARQPTGPLLLASLARSSSVRAPGARRGGTRARWPFIRTSSGTRLVVLAKVNRDPTSRNLEPDSDGETDMVGLASVEAI